MKFAPDGVAIAWVDARTEKVWIWYPQTGVCLRSSESMVERCETMVWSPDGRHIACGGKKGVIGLFVTNKDEWCAYLRGHSDEVASLQYSLDGRTIASTSVDDTIRIWDASTAACRHVLPAQSRFPIRSMQFSTTGLVLVTASDDGAVRAWDTITGSCLHALHVAASADIDSKSDDAFIQVSADTYKATRVYGDGRLMTWDIATGQCEQETEEDDLFSIAYNAHPLNRIEWARWLCRFDKRPGWIAGRGVKKSVWLPHEYRPVDDGIEYYDNRLVVGSGANRLTIVNLKKGR